MTCMRVLVTGGAGFIGLHSCMRFASEGFTVTVLDDLSRIGSEENLNLLVSAIPNLNFIKCDISKKADLDLALKDLRFDCILHLAAQTAVTISVTNPQLDFDVNASGSFNILEWARLQETKPILIYSSTNKVYGSLPGLELQENSSRYLPSQITESLGVDENFQLSFRSPYGCSKGYADQLFLDFFDTYGLRTVVFRQSCIYGTHQFGVEDQGWLAWMAVAGLKNHPVTIFGDGKQVRDVLFVDDLVSAFELAIKSIDRVSGEVFNIGGGYPNSLSILEYLDYLEELKVGVTRSFAETRVGDQKYYVSNNDKAALLLGWRPKVRYSDGIPQMVDWIRKYRL